MKIVTGIVVLLMMTASCSAQDQGYDPFDKRRQVGFNMTELISSLIPFRDGITPSGPFGVTWRAGRERFFNFQMGARVADVFEEDFNFLNIQVGFGKRQLINEKFSYFNTYNLILSGGGFNLPGERLGDDEGTIGISFGGGIEYQLYKSISLSVETLFVVGSGGDGPKIQIIPPVGVNMHARF